MNTNTKTRDFRIVDIQEMLDAAAGEDIPACATDRETRATWITDRALLTATVTETTIRVTLLNTKTGVETEIGRFRGDNADEQTATFILNILGLINA